MHTPRIKPIMRAYWPPIAVQLLPGQYSQLRRLAASCIVWDKAEPAIRTILHDALNGQWWRTSISSVTHSLLPGGWVTKLYACALLIIDGLGHATWSSTMPVSRSRTAPFERNRHIIFLALVVLEPLVSLMSKFGACSARIRGDRHTHTQTHRHTDTQTHRASTVTLAAHAHRGLITRYKQDALWSLLILTVVIL